MIDHRCRLYQPIVIFQLTIISGHCLFSLAATVVVTLRPQSNYEPRSGFLCVQCSRKAKCKCMMSWQVPGDPHRAYVVPAVASGCALSATCPRRLLSPRPLSLSSLPSRWPEENGTCPGFSGEDGRSGRLFSQPFASLQLGVFCLAESGELAISEAQYIFKAGISSFSETCSF